MEHKNTLRERFEKDFNFLGKMTKEGVLSFFRQELLALTEEATRIHQDPTRNSAPDIITLIRTKADELL